MRRTCGSLDYMKEDMRLQPERVCSWEGRQTDRIVLFCWRFLIGKSGTAESEQASLHLVSRLQCAMESAVRYGGAFALHRRMESHKRTARSHCYSAR